MAATIDSIVQSSITRADVFPTARGFGIPLFVAFHSFWIDTVRRFTSLAGLASAGVPTYHPIYLWATAVFSSPRRPEAIVIGKRSSYTMVFTLTIKDATAGKIYRFTITDALGVSTVIERTVPGASSTTAEATAIAALIDATASSVAAAVGAVITVTCTAGAFVGISGLEETPISMMEYKDTSADPGLAADLATIRAAMLLSASTSAYGFALDRGGEAEIAALASFCEANKLAYFARSTDSIIATSSTTDVASDLKALSYANTVGLFVQNANNDFRDGAAIGYALPRPPGSYTLAHKTLPGSRADVLTEGERGYVLAKNWSTYEEVGGINELFEAKTPSGGFVDTTIFLHMVEARIAEAVYGRLVTADVVPYTQPGIDLVLGDIKATLFGFTKPPSPGFSTSPMPEVDQILETDVPSTNKATRRLTGVTWRAETSGAIHGVSVAGTVGV